MSMIAIRFPLLPRRLCAITVWRLVLVARHVPEPERPYVLAHEAVHVRQQGWILRALLYWLPRYALDRGFRYRQEIEAYRAELQAHPEEDRLWVAGQLAEALVRDYRLQVPFLQVVRDLGV